MKKILIIILSILVVSLLAGIFVFKIVKTDNNESMPDIEQVQKEQQEIKEEPNQEDTVKAEESSQEVPKTELKTEKKVIFNLPFKKPQVKIPEPDKNLLNQPVAEESSNTADEKRKYTPEEEEALKKIPRSDVVVVDKEIKLKSSGKYRFK